MGIQYNPDGTMEQFGPGQTYGLTPGSDSFRMNPNANLGGTYDASASNAMGGGLSTTSTGTQYGTSQVAGQVVSQTPNTANGGGFQGLLQALMTQAQTDYQARMKQYHNLLGSITGPKGLLSQLGKTGETRIAMDEKNQLGQSDQDLTSRGLGNSTIRGSMQSGIKRNAEMERQSLSEGIAGTKIGASEQLFGMNPAPGMDTYLNLLSKLGGTSGLSGMSGMNSTPTMGK